MRNPNQPIRLESIEQVMERITRAFASFPGTAGGQEFFQRTGYAGYAPLSTADRAQLRSYISLTKRLLELP